MDEQIIYGSLIFFVAFFIRSLTGFGAGLIAIPVLALMYPLKFVVPMQLLFEVGISLILLPKVWHDVDWKHVWNLLAGLFVGNMTGAFVLANIDNRILIAVLAGVVFLFAIYLWWVARNPVPWKINPRWGFLFGMGGGVFGGSLGMSGPLIVLYLSQQFDRKETLRASIIGLFLFASSWTVCAHWYNGLYTLESLKVAAMLVPAFLAGTMLGHWAHFRISEFVFRRIIAVILFASGALLVFT